MTNVNVDGAVITTMDGTGMEFPSSGTAVPSNLTIGNATISAEGVLRDGLRADSVDTLLLMDSQIASEQSRGIILEAANGVVPTNVTLRRVHATGEVFAAEMGLDGYTIAASQFVGAQKGVSIEP